MVLEYEILIEDENAGIEPPTIIDLKRAISKEQYKLKRLKS